MAPKKAPYDPTNQVGKPASAYNKMKSGDSWFTEEQNTMDNRKTNNAPEGGKTDFSGRATSDQLKDQSKRYSEGVAGAIPSYKKGGIVKKSGLAKLHAGEKVIRKQDVKRTEKAVRKYGGKK